MTSQPITDSGMLSAYAGRCRWIGFFAVAVILHGGCAPRIDSNDPIERNRAASNITDGSALALIASNDPDDSVRYTAAQRLLMVRVDLSAPNQVAILAKLALFSHSEDVRNQAYDSVRVAVFGAEDIGGTKPYLAPGWVSDDIALVSRITSACAALPHHRRDDIEHAILNVVHTLSHPEVTKIIGRISEITVDYSETKSPSSYVSDDNSYPKHPSRLQGEYIFCTIGITELRSFSWAWATTFENRYNAHDAVRGVKARLTDELPILNFLDQMSGEDLNKLAKVKDYSNWSNSLYIRNAALARLATRTNTSASQKAEPSGPR